MQQYFDAQMRLLAQAGKQFAAQYPEHAGQLNIDSIKERDPHVERLLEGVAYFTANIQQRLDGVVPEVSEQVLRQLCPVLLNHYPSTTVFQFSPKFSYKDPTIIKKGMEVSSNQVAINLGHERKTIKCKFTTCHDLNISPFTVVDAICKETHQGSELRIKLKWNCQGEVENFDLSSLRFYLNGDTPLVSSLYHLMLTANEAIQVVFPVEQSQFDTKLIQKNACAANFNSNDALLPSAASSHPSYALLHDYFNGKERFNFVDVNGLNEIDFPENFRSVELVFKSKIKLPPGNKLSAENLLLNCVTGINLFNQDAEPIHIDTNCTDYMITPDRSKLDSIFTYSVNNVVGVADKGTVKKSYIPRYKSMLSPTQNTYTLNIKDIGAAVPTHYIQVPVSQAWLDQTLSIEISAYNGHWPKHSIREGQLNQGGKDLPALINVANISRPSNYKKCLEQSAHWQLISLLNLKFTSLMNADELKHLLTLFNWSDRDENSRRINAIEHIESHKINQIKRGVFIQGVEIVITIDESKFSCASDVYHFSSLLHHFFVMYAPINQSVQTRVKCVPSFTDFVWAIELGKNSLL